MPGSIKVKDVIARNQSQIDLPAAANDREYRAFLPAALEIVETPASPAPRIVGLAIGSFLVLAIVWACIGKIDIIAVAPGRIVLADETKIVQPLETGVVSALHVQDGDHVEAGQLLVEIDPSSNLADQRKAAHDGLQARLDRSRLAGLNRVFGSDARPALVDPPNDAPEDALAMTEATMRAQAAEQAAKLANIDQQIAAKHAERAEATAQIDKGRALLPYLQEQEEIYAKLLTSAFAKRTDWLSAKEKLVDQEQELTVVGKKVDEVAAALVGLDRQRDQMRAEFEKQVLTDLAEAGRKAAAFEADGVKAATHASLQSLHAPVAGTVQEMSIHTIGGVVTPAQPILAIVPDDRGLYVEASITNRDIGFVQEGQTVDVKIDAFPFTKYGAVTGRILNVDRDTAAEDSSRRELRKSDDKSAGAEKETASPYRARIALDRATVAVDGTPRRLEAGMKVTADIKTGRRRLIDYLLSPLQQYTHDALRER